MMNLNDTISAFRCCTLTPLRCSECPLTEMCKGSLSKDRCKTEVKLSVNQWLTVQKPRVMAVEDMWILKFNDTVILEQKIPPLLIPAIVRDNIHHDDALEVLQVVTASTSGTANADYDYYGKTWRCWTSRPTEAEREATPWN